jgi:hypothetical protein
VISKSNDEVLDVADRLQASPINLFERLFHRLACLSSGIFLSLSIFGTLRQMALFCPVDIHSRDKPVMLNWEAQRPEGSL